MLCIILVFFTVTLASLIVRWRQQWEKGRIETEMLRVLSTQRYGGIDWRNLFAWGGGTNPTKQ